MSDTLTTLILGIVEGLTEYLPVSSTGHLILAGDLLSYSGEKAKSFKIFIQLGAILSVVLLYKERFLSFLSFQSKASFSGKQGIYKLIVASIPIMLLGFFFGDLVKEKLFSPESVAWALIIGGALMYLVEHYAREIKTVSIDQLTTKTVFLIGVAQCLALWPGFSRAGATIVAGMLLGSSRKVAAELSFLLAVPVLGAASVYDAIKIYPSLNAQDLFNFALGFIVSFFVAIFSIKFLLAILQRYSLKPFAIYRIILGAAILIAIK